MATANRRDIVIDQYFSVPSGLVDARYENKSDGEFNYTDDDQADSFPTLTDPQAIIPTLPLTSFKIVDQTIRISSDGRVVVDVTFEFPDVQGIDSVAIREAKL